MSLHTFIVIEKGVYRHDIWGPFSTQKDAEAKAKEVSSEGVRKWTYPRNDGWHDYEVWNLNGHLEDSLGAAPLAVFRSGKRVSL